MHKGLYLLCDGGYHKWRIRVIQCLNKLDSNEGPLRFSQGLESVRKDVRVHLRYTQEKMLDCDDRNDEDDDYYICADSGQMLWIQE